MEQGAQNKDLWNKLHCHPREKDSALSDLHPKEWETSLRQTSPSKSFPIPFPLFSFTTELGRSRQLASKLGRKQLVEGRNRAKMPTSTLDPCQPPAQGQPPESWEPTLRADILISVLSNLGTCYLRGIKVTGIRRQGKVSPTEQISKGLWETKKKKIIKTQIVVVLQYHFSCSKDQLHKIWESLCPPPQFLSAKWEREWNTFKEWYFPYLQELWFGDYNYVLVPSDKARSDPIVILEIQIFRILGSHYRTRDNNPECTKEECGSLASLRFMCKKEVVKCKVKENSLSGHTKK